MPKNLLTSLADNKELLEAVRGVFLKQFELCGLSYETDDIMLGQSVRASLVGKAGVEAAIKEIEQYKTVPQSTHKDNPAY